MSYLSHLLEYGWNIAVRNKGTGTLLADQKTPFELIPNTWRTWAADPFIFEYNGSTYIFAELFDYIERRGSLGYTVLKNGQWSKWKAVIREPFHMSYPNVFVKENDIYMIPESSADHTLRMYKAISFPDEWKLEKIIANDVMWVDTTFFRDKGILHAITTDVTVEENHIDYLLTLTDNYDLIDYKEINEKNTEYSRSGGKFFNCNGTKIRVTQDCKNHYGEGMIFSKFTPDDLVNEGKGEEILHLFPKDIVIQNKSAQWTGLHTYNSTVDYEVVDIERKHFNLPGIITRLSYKFRKH